MTRIELLESLLLRGDDNFRQLYLVPALEAGWVEMTIPDKPNSRLQKYRLTAKGRAWLAAKRKEGKKKSPPLIWQKCARTSNWTKPPRKSPRKTAPWKQLGYRLWAHLEDFHHASYRTSH